MITWPSPIAEQASRALAFVRRYERTLWWLHSVYALALGLGVVVFASRGFEHASTLLATLIGAWFLIFAFFQWQQIRTHRVSSLIVSYALKNLYQTAFFFSLPFYYRATTLDSPNLGAFVVLVIAVLLSTLDRVFDGVVLKHRLAAATLHAVCIFYASQLAFPALVPELSVGRALTAAAVLTALSSFSVYASTSQVFGFRRLRTYLAAGAFAALCATLAHFGRSYLPPVPLYLTYGSVGTDIGADGRLQLAATTIASPRLKDLHAVSEIALPSGKGDKLLHTWKCNQQTFAHFDEEAIRVGSAEGMLRLRSSLRGVSGAPKPGPCSVDTETEDGRLVGRIRFELGP
jgi:Family of unknown function (DUF5924)